MSSVFPLTFNNFIVKNKRLPFDTWWDTNVKSIEPKMWVTHNTEKITHGDYIRDFYYRLKKMIIASGYSIKDEKQFKQDIAKFIYQLSSER
jgi:hypothetical protein